MPRRGRAQQAAQRASDGGAGMHGRGAAEHKRCRDFSINAEMHTRVINNGLLHSIPGGPSMEGGWYVGMSLYGHAWYLLGTEYGPLYGGLTAP